MRRGNGFHNRRSAGSSSGPTPPTANLWASYQKGIGITAPSGVGTGVVQWADQSGNGRNITQLTGSLQPLLQADGSMLFDGIDDYLKAATGVLAQPFTFGFRIKQLTWTVNDSFCDGDTVTTALVWQTATTPDIRQYAGITTSPNSNLPLNTWATVIAIFNGASSSLQVDNTAAVVSDAGASAANGFTLGARATGGSAANIQVADVEIYSAALSGAALTQLKAYLDTK